MVYDKVKELPLFLEKQKIKKIAHPYLKWRVHDEAEEDYSGLCFNRDGEKHNLPTTNHVSYIHERDAKVGN